MQASHSIRINNSTGVCTAEEDSRLLAETALGNHPAGRALDLGTGTGYVAIFLALHGCKVDAVDISPRALALAQSNAKLNGVSLNIFSSNLLGNVTGTYDVIACNPPMRAEENEFSRLITSTLRPFKSFTNVLLKFSQPILERRRIDFLAGLANSASDYLAPKGRLVLVISPFEESELPLRVPKLSLTESNPVPLIRGLRVATFTLLDEQRHSQ
jgi:SAM-dependent methyltransferase